MRRYRITWNDTPPGDVVDATMFSLANRSAPDIVLASLKLTLGQSVTFGGGAAPVTVITCIEE